VVDRIRRALAQVSDRISSVVEPISTGLGSAFGVADWAVELFAEEVVRGGPAFALSLVRVSSIVCSFPLRKLSMAVLTLSCPWCGGRQLPALFARPSRSQRHACSVPRRPSVDEVSGRVWAGTI